MKKAVGAVYIHFNVVLHHLGLKVTRLLALCSFSADPSCLLMHNARMFSEVLKS